MKKKKLSQSRRVWNGKKVSIVLWDTDSEERTPGFKPLIKWLENHHVPFSWCEWPDDCRIGGVGEKLPWENEELDARPILDFDPFSSASMIEVHVGRHWFFGFVPDLMDLLCMEDQRRCLTSIDINRDQKEKQR